ncbi:MAG: hypothetical protein WBL61_02275 [Bryobacteraceae bacterium]
METPRLTVVLAITALSLYCQSSSDKGGLLPASIRNVKVRLLAAGSPLYGAGPDNKIGVVDARPPIFNFGVEFEATVKNDRQTEIQIGTEPVYSAPGDMRLETGEWTKNFFPSWLDDGKVKYDQCSVIPPGGIYILPKVPAQIYLRETDWHVPPSVTVRFRVITQCMEGSREGQRIRSEVIQTEPVEITLPPIPEK